ncbi:rhamnulokinase [Zafaria sp. Z1313]|uniref:rhamnulokinase n=1 Tax=Zafaria sp. Z1313 TaxID=3423202 RepID=UPI003D301850
MEALYAAVDIGASSGRVVLGRVGATASLEVVHRFPHGVVERGGSLRWDLEELYAQVLAGLRRAGEAAAAAGGRIRSIGIDTWAVDYGLHRGGRLTAPPHAYRDPRTESAVAAVHARVPPAELYAVNGLQFLPFNTLYQLAAEPELHGLTALLIPDLLAYRLTGRARTESTNASTTGLLEAATGRFAAGLMERLGIPESLFPPLIDPGDAYGGLLPEAAAAAGLAEGTAVVAVGSHDTASAVAAVPAGSGPFAYVSSGTWSLVGVELEAPVLTEAGRAANFTNERGVDGTIRYLRNVGGLWLLSESLRQWAADGVDVPPLPELLAAAAALPAGGPLVDPDDAGFIAPGGMVERIRAAAARGAGDPGDDAGAPPLDPAPAAVVRCILDSLAAAYARTIARAAGLSGVRPEVVHIVGGGSQNALLCQLTADATGLPVLAGPVEATAMGNILVQARADGVLGGGLAALRRVVRDSIEPVCYSPG